MQKQGESIRRLSRRSAAAAFLLVYALAALLGIFHDRHDSRIPTHDHATCAGHDDVESSDGKPAHDESRCGLCHIFASEKLAPATAADPLPVALPTFDRAPRPHGAALVSSIPGVAKPRAPPAA